MISLIKLQLLVSYLVEQVTAAISQTEATVTVTIIAAF